MRKNIIIFSVLSLVTMIFLAGCAKAPTSAATAPTVPSGNVESSSSSVETTADTFVNDATPTSDQEVPNLT